MTGDQAYLDGYRDGLGAAIRALESIREVSGHPCVHHALIASAADSSAPEVVAATLRGVANGLRMLSASVRLDDDGCGAQSDDNAEPTH